MKINVELSSEEEFIQFASYMQQEKHNLAEVLFNRYKNMYESTAAQLKSLQDRLLESPEDINKYYAVEIDEPFNGFDFSNRTINVLKAEQIYTIGHLLEHTENDLMRFINMGKKSIKDVKDTLASNGLQLKVKATK